MYHKRLESEMETLGKGAGFHQVEQVMPKTCPTTHEPPGIPVELRPLTAKKRKSTGDDSQSKSVSYGDELQS